MLCGWMSNHGKIEMTQAVKANPLSQVSCAMGLKGMLLSYTTGRQLLPRSEQNASVSGARVILEAFAALLMIVLLGAIAYFAFTPLYFFFHCRIVKENRVPSPSGRYEAVAFVKDCGGAASAFTPYVSILKSGEKLRSYEDGNVFDGSAGEYYIKVQWITDTQMKVSYTLNKNIKPRRMVREQGGITVDYQLVQSSDSL